MKGFFQRKVILSLLCAVCIVSVALWIGFNRSAANSPTSLQNNPASSQISNAAADKSSSIASAPGSSYECSVTKTFNTYDECIADINKNTIKDGTLERVEIPYQEINKTNNKLYKGSLGLQEIRRIGKSERFTALYSGIVSLS